MKQTAQPAPRPMAKLLAVAICLALAGAAAAAQPKSDDLKPFGVPGTGVSPAAAPPAGAAPAAPKPSLSPAQSLEESLMSNLARRDMDNLLKHYFDKNNIPPERREQILSFRAWDELKNPNLSPIKKHQLITAAVKGIEGFIANTRDTEQLMNMAALLIESGMKGQINQIEYFGPTPTRLNELNETAGAVVKILGKAVEECELQQNAILGGRTRPDDVLMKKWQTLDDRLQAAKWTRAFSEYGLALSMDTANPKRADIAKAAIAFLTEFEAPEFQREGPVRIQIGKLHMVAGNWDAAIKKWDEASKKQLDKFGQYEIKFYTTLNALLARRDKAADAALKDLQAWCKSNLSAAELKEVSAGMGLLEYRIADLQAAAMKDPTAQRKKLEEGEAALSRVMKEHPQLEPVIKRMLLEKLPADADVTKLDTVLLRALMAKGVDEFLRAKDGAVDEKGRPVVERAVKSAQEIQKRKGQANVTEDVEDEAAFLEAMLLGKLRKGEKDDPQKPNPVIQSIEASLHYISDHRKNPDRAALVLDNALTCVEILRRDADAVKNAKNGELINRTWELAISSGQKQYTYPYGRRLFDLQQFKKAADFLGRVPAAHPAKTHACFFQLNALQQLLNEKDIDAASKQALIGQIQKVAAELNQRIDGDLAKAKDDQKPRLNFYKVSSTLLAAELMLNELKKPEDTLKSLTGLEEAAKGLPGEDKLIGTALHLRVNALMALNRTPEAVAAVKALVETGAKNAPYILYQMLKKMDDSYDAAKKVGDKERMRILSGGQASLITLLIEKTTDEKMKDAYEERRAVLLVNAARNENDEKKRVEYLNDAQKSFNALLAKAPEGSPKQDNYRYRLAVISFELKDYQKVQTEMGQLIAMGKLGPPDRTEADPTGEGTIVVDNPVYWEGVLRFMQANFELSKANPTDVKLLEAVKDNKEVLKALYINRGKTVGGERFRDDYAQFKKAILGDWDETKLGTTRPSTQPATRP